MQPTPLSKFGPVFLKREDLNPTGSAKDRSLPKQIAEAQKLGFSSFVISSTGNAAISAATATSLANLPLNVYLSPTVPTSKSDILKKFPHLKIVLDPRPTTKAFRYAKENNSYFLRQSTDPVALLGYQSIGEELLQQLPETTSVFVPIGSGTTLMGISQSVSPKVAIFGCQSAANPTLQSISVNTFSPERTMLTSALTAKSLPLKQQLELLLKQPQNHLLICQNNDIYTYWQQLLEQGIEVSSETGLALAAYYQAFKLNLNIGSHPVIIATGTKR